MQELLPPIRKFDIADVLETHKNKKQRLSANTEKKCMNSSFKNDSYKKSQTTQRKVSKSPIVNRQSRALNRSTFNDRSTSTNVHDDCYKYSNEDKPKIPLMPINCNKTSKLFFLFKKANNSTDRTNDKNSTIDTNDIYDNTIGLLPSQINSDIGQDHSSFSSTREYQKADDLKGNVIVSDIKLQNTNTRGAVRSKFKFDQRYKDDELTSVDLNESKQILESNHSILNETQTRISQTNNLLTENKINSKTKKVQFSDDVKIFNYRLGSIILKQKRPKCFGKYFFCF